MLSREEKLDYYFSEFIVFWTLPLITTFWFSKPLDINHAYFVSVPAFALADNDITRQYGQLDPYPYQGQPLPPVNQYVPLPKPQQDNNELLYEMRLMRQELEDQNQIQRRDYRERRYRDPYDIQSVIVD